MNIAANFWTGIPVDKIAQWQSAFEGQRDIHVTSPCPVCGVTKLRQYYHLEKSQSIEFRGSTFVGRGSYWSWCANCGAYEHASSFVPSDWCRVVLPLDHAALTPLPTELEIAVSALASKS